MSVRGCKRVRVTVCGSERDGEEEGRMEREEGSTAIGGI